MCWHRHVLALIVPLGIGGFIFFGFWLWGFLDTIATESLLVRNLPKETWVFVVILVPVGGALAWLLLGRPLGAGIGLGGSYRPPTYGNASRARGFEDSPDWDVRKERIRGPRIDERGVSEADNSETNAVKERRLLEWEAELAKREAALDDVSDVDPSNDADGE